MGKPSTTKQVLTSLDPTDQQKLKELLNGVEVLITMNNASIAKIDRVRAEFNGKVGKVDAARHKVTSAMFNYLESMLLVDDDNDSPVTELSLTC